MDTYRDTHGTSHGTHIGYTGDRNTRAHMIRHDFNHFGTHRDDSVHTRDTRGTHRDFTYEITHGTHMI